jgi:4-hydroxy-tetrahydrodipicolinate synthase
MAGLNRLTGCGTALITPFRRDGSVDDERFAAFVDWQVREGVHFVSPCGTTGESVTLAPEDYLRVVRITVETVDRRVPVIAGAGGNNTTAVIQRIRELKRLGVDGILSVSPYYNKPTQEGIYQHFRALAQSTDLPLIVYNVPGRTGSNVLPETVLRLAEVPNIVGVKEASGDISQIGEICTRAPEQFRILSGDDSLTLPLIAVGGHGVISVASNEAPRMMSQLAAACLQGNWEEARKLNRKLYPLMKVNFVETSPIPVKAALAMMGKIEEVYRLPLVGISEPGRAKLAAVLRQLELIP